MKLAIIGIFDRKAQTFVTMEPTPNPAVAIRQIGEIVNTQTDSNFYKWPGDYSLWQLGTWDNETGQPTPLEKQLIIELENLKQH